MAFSLLLFPDDLIVSLLVEWLGIQNLAHLDSAICHHKTRPLFLGLLSSEHPGISSVAFMNKALVLNSGVVSWLESRRIFMKHLKFRGDSYDTFVPSPFLPTTGGRVQCLWFSNCYNITDTGLRSIAEGCPNLQPLKLNNCYSITDAGLGSIAEGCSGLQSLDLRHCYSITNEGVQMIRESYPNLRIRKKLVCCV